MKAQANPYTTSPKLGCSISTGGQRKPKPVPTPQALNLVAAVPIPTPQALHPEPPPAAKQRSHKHCCLPCPEAVVLPRESMRQVTGQLQQLLGAEVQGYMISPSRQLVRKLPPKLVVTNTLQCACAGIPTAESRKTRRINEPIRF